jgi:hypothetical protein
MIKRSPTHQFRFYQAISNTLMMGAESVPETLKNFYSLTQLSAQKDVIENWYVCTNFIKPGQLRIACKLVTFGLSSGHGKIIS